MNVKTISFALMPLTFCGCATILSTSTYDVWLRTSPPGASFKVSSADGRYAQTGTTPATVTLKANSGFFRPAIYNIEYKLLGYEPTADILQATMDPAYAFNLVTTGPIGLLLFDPASGAMWELPRSCHATLRQSPGSYVPHARDSACTNNARENNDKIPNETMHDGDVSSTHISDDMNDPRIEKVKHLYMRGELSEQEYLDLMKQLKGEGVDQ